MRIAESDRFDHHNPQLDPLEISSDYNTNRYAEDEVKKRLSIYGSASLMVKDINVYDKGRRGIARFVAIGEPVRPILSGDLDAENGKGRYKITEIDAKDHFVENTGLVINPGIRNIAIARRTVDEYVHSQDPKRGLARISSVNFKLPVAPGAVVDADMHMTQEKIYGELGFAGSVSSGDKTIVDLELGYRSDVPLHIPGVTVDPEYFIESAAQSALLLMQESRELDGMDDIFPLFGGFDNVIIDNTVKLGESVTIDVSIEPVGNKISGSAKIFKADGSTVMKINDVNCIIRKKNERILGVLQRTIIR